MVTEGQAAQLKHLLEEFILGETFRRPEPTEGEVSYTSGVLHPIVKKFCESKFNHDGIIVRGDGAKLKSPVVSFLGGGFNPDVSIEQEKIRVWACEVKLLSEEELSGVIAKAIGQATIYSRSYLSASCLIFLRNPMTVKAPKVVEAAPNLNVLLIPTK